jgi:hypothetical protein
VEKLHPNTLQLCGQGKEVRKPLYIQQSSYAMSVSLEHGSIRSYLEQETLGVGNGSNHNGSGSSRVRLLLRKRSHDQRATAAAKATKGVKKDLDVKTSQQFHSPS